MYRIPAGGDPDYPAIDILVHALGTAPTGRLHIALVQKGLASYAWASERALHDPGTAYFGAGLPAGASLEAAREALVAALEGLANDPIRAEEIERARTALLNEFEKSQIDAGALVRTLSEFAAMGDWRMFFLYRDRLRGVTEADVRRVAAAYLKPANRVLGEFLPTAAPDRAEIPPAPDLAKALDGYRGSDGVELGEAFEPTPQNIEARVIRKTLANGIRVALLPKKTRGGAVVAQLALYWGDESSKMNRGTACTLAGGMLMRGSLKHSRAELRDALDRLKATVSVSLDGAHVEARRAELAETLRLVAEMLREPAFPGSEFEELKRAALTGAEAQRSDPSARSSERLARHLNPYPRGHWLQTLTVDERIEELQRASLEDAKRCYADFLGATGAEFVAVGDFDPDALQAQLATLFGDWKTAQPYVRIPQRYFERPATDEELRTPDKANAVLRAGLNVALRDDDPDFPALVLGNYLLGGSASNRLTQRVREKDGLSYSVFSFFNASPLDQAAGFIVGAIFAPQNKARVEKAIEEEIARALKEGFTDAELEAGKKGLLESRRIARAQDRTLASRLASYLFAGRSFAWDIEFEKRIAALSAAEVRDALRRHLDPLKLSVVKAGDFR
jgi:zinc protease